jgi:hypothetical protein
MVSVIMNGYANLANRKFCILSISIIHWYSPCSPVKVLRLALHRRV